MPILTVETLCFEAAIFSAAESQHPEPILYGVNPFGEFKIQNQDNYWDL